MEEISDELKDFKEKYGPDMKYSDEKLFHLLVEKLSEA